MTLKEVLEILPPEYGDKIRNNTHEYRLNSRMPYERVRSIVNETMTWGYTPEGQKYWSDVHAIVTNHEVFCRNKLII